MDGTKISSPVAKPRIFALVGNPNCGKTTLFNGLTGLRQKVGNYPGVTVERKTGTLYSQHGEPIELIDLPGSYSLHPRSPDEAITSATLLGNTEHHARPEAIICVVDASNLERHLYLATQVIELGLPTVIALNMMDTALNAGISVNAERLARELGAPVIQCQATKPSSLVALRVAISQLREQAKPQWRILGSTDFREAVGSLAHCIEHDQGLSKREAYARAQWYLTEPRNMYWQSLHEFKHAVQRESQKIKTLSGQKHTAQQAQEIKAHLSSPEASESIVDKHWLECPGTITSCIAEHQARLAAIDPDWNEKLVRERYDLLKKIVSKCVKHIALDQPSLTERIDRVVLHPLWGAVALIGILGILFYSLFFIAEVPKGWIESGMEVLSECATAWLPAGLLQELVCDGMLAGVGAVLAFLPQILILMFFIGMLESTGYMARAAFILDRLMQRVGLQGRSFIPILSSYACAIPGVLATRTIDSPKDRLATILVAPFASCSARLPVYAVMIATLAPGGQSSAGLKAGLMLLMYILGTSAAFGFAWLFKQTFLKGSSALGVMELPPYRWPHLSYLLWDMWHRTKTFVTNAGTVILALSIILWFALSHPRNHEATPSEQLAASYGGKLGQWIEPVIEPLGFDWKVGIGIVASFAAREVFVSTLAIVYHVEDASIENPTSIEEALRNQKRADGSLVFTARTCLSLMIFYVFAMQCMSTLAAVKRETGSWRWPVFQLAYMTSFAYLAAWLVYQVGGLLGFA